MQGSKEFQRGIDDRLCGKGFDRNPYSPLFEEKHKDWENGWKLEHWRETKMGKINLQGDYQWAITVGGMKIATRKETS